MPRRAALPAERRELRVRVGHAVGPRALWQRNTREAAHSSGALPANSTALHYSNSSEPNPFCDLKFWKLRRLKLEVPNIRLFCVCVFMSAAARLARGHWAEDSAHDFVIENASDADAGDYWCECRTPRELWTG